MDKEILEQYCKDGLSTYAISRKENISQTTVVYWIKKYKLSTKHWSLFDKHVLIDVVKNSKSYHDVLIKLGKNTSSNSYRSLKRAIVRFNIDTTHFMNRSEYLKNAYLKKQKTVDEYLKLYFTENSLICRNSIKKLILRLKLLEYVCSECGQDEWWRGKKISLILDHINGVNNDNRIFNLRFVCPNCNATLDTHCKNKKH